MMLIKSLYLLFLSSAMAVLAEPMGVVMLGGSPASGYRSLDQMVRAMLVELQNSKDAEESVVVDSFPSPTEGNLTELLLQSRQEISARLTSSSSGNKPNYVVLQEDREVPGYTPPDDNNSREEMWEISVNTLHSLQGLIQQEAGSTTTTVLLQTPAYMDGSPDNYNKDIYTSFEKMQDMIEHGYKLYYRELEEENPRAQVKIAPCGWAFLGVYQDYDASNLFDRLYEADRKTPSVLGNYLCAAVLVNTMTGRDVRQITYQPPHTGGEDVWSFMKTIAYRTVSDYHNGGQLPKFTKRYRPAGEQKRTRWGGLFQFFLAALMGGGVLYYFVASKWYGAAETVHDMSTDAGYRLLPSSGILMELMEQPADTPPSNEPQWINPV
ncbi:expressed unknown protein [Seminavis robusta]|uniref:Uncharacterized protein n=1 Tax=Seminavis robusta TaxID=568900 RepID=A0A9N8E6E2_9STRA|nr:expressed unknown protein [Seminavis robusta]|eukprot:Sro592_g172170.1 n/a (380) ;mRNA; f:44015-45154